MQPDSGQIHPRAEGLIKGAEILRRGDGHLRTLLPLIAVVVFVLVASVALKVASGGAFANPSGVPDSSTPTGISLADAQRLADTHLGNGAAFVSATAGPFVTTYQRDAGQVGTDLGVPDATWVWVLTYSTTVAPCPPLFEQTCLPARPATVVVVLDFASGAFEFSSLDAPAP
jgi:hypothetical protein